MSSSVRNSIATYIANSSTVTPLLLQGDASSLLDEFPDSSVDCCITSPPYWNKRQYAGGGIGLESDVNDYIQNICSICSKIYRLVKPTGSFWLNVGDSYFNKSLLNIPWRIAIELTQAGWILRNTIIWNKVKGGMDNTLDRLGNIYEPIFHFVKKPKGYYYNIDCIRKAPQTPKIVKGAVVSATGVTGVSYKRKIELSTALSEDEKKRAMQELEAILQQIQSGKLSDFRMVIRGVQRTTHSDSEKVSGRAKELREKGFYFLKYNPKGCKPSDVWDILPEASQGRSSHFAPYPTDLCRTPITLTCPEGGIVLDPFVGTGTSCVVACENNRKSIGIDISSDYLKLASERCHINEEKQLLLKSILV